MIIEDEIISEYKNYMSNNSKYASVFNVYPASAKNKPTFPCGVLKEINNSNSQISLNKMEYLDSVSFQLDLYSQDITFNGKKVPARVVMNTLREETYKFFLLAGFNRDRDTRGETRNLNLLRRTMIFSATLSSWNKNII